MTTDNTPAPQGDAVRAVAYTRVACAAPESSRSLEAQLRECRRYAAELGLEIAGEFTDLGPGSTEPALAPALERALGFLRANAITVLVVFDRARLSRQLAQFSRVQQHLDSLGIDVRFARGADRDDSERIEAIKQGITQYLFGLQAGER